ncbi:MAG: hypothetical protein KIT14_24655 [bacterium]|nr:hypothetical protein [bacterium]
MSITSRAAVRTTALVLIATAALPILAAAADAPVAAKKLLLKRAGSGREKLVFLVKGAGLPFPAVGSADDPASGTPGGMTVELFSQTEGGPHALSVPPGIGKPGWKVTDAATDSYRYANGAAPAGPSPVKVAVLKQGKLLKITAAATGLALAGPQGRVAVRVTTGTLRSCAVFAAGAIRRDVAGSFTAVNAAAPAIADCSDASLGGGATSTTTTTLPAGNATVLDFTTVVGTGACGVTRDASDAVLKSLTCGGLNIGGGNSTVLESITPDGGTNRMAVTGCTDDVCTLGPWAAPGPSFDCTTTGCSFGPPLPIANAGTSTCVVNTLSAPVAGSLDLATGTTSDLSLKLSSSLYLTGNATQPCPRCSASGTPEAPGAGTCDRGARSGLACASTNSQGLSRDCPPGGAGSGNPCTPGATCTDGSQNLGAIPIDLTPLTTGAVSRTAANGLFCPGQAAGQRGCFIGGANCTAIEESGVPAGALLPAGTTRPITFASIFCIPTTTSPLVNFAANLPGPGANSLVGNITLRELVAPGTTTTTTLEPGTTTTTLPATTTTSSTIFATTTTTTLPPGAEVLDFTTLLGTGACGVVRDGSSSTIRPIACGGLDIGGGAATVPEGLIPDGATSRFQVVGCDGSSCTLVATAGAPGGIDCTQAGCRFGPPLPIANAGLSTCIVNTFASNGHGTLDKATGALSLAVPLATRVFLTGDAAQPCPRCSATGSPGNPGVGTCDRGARAGQSCSTTNSQGLSADCAPGGADGSSDLGSISVDLSPLVTTTASAANPAGLFCPGQTAGGNAGCFGATACRSFQVDGLPAGPIVPDTPQAVSLASAFCIPAVGNIVIDGAAGLPGPGAASLPGSIALRTLPGGPTTTTTSTTLVTTTTVAGPTTTTTTTTSTTTTTLLPPLLPLTVEFASLAGSGSCGTMRNGSGAVVGTLACGDLALGHGGGSLPPSALPDGAVVHFKLGGCSVLPLLTCALGPEPTAGAGYDCTTTGCFFGAPVPIPNGGLSACSVNTFSGPVSGSVNLLTGATTTNVPLSLHVYVTGNAAQPCPRCSATGAPGAIGTGTCDRGARAGLACSTTNSQGLSKDCLPGGGDSSVDVGSINANLSPVTTGSVSLSNPSGLFCPGQTVPGCFGNPSCRSITETGSAPNAALSSLVPQPATLASVFCVPATGNVLLDAPAGLPGPAAISLPGQVRSQL